MTPRFFISTPTEWPHEHLKHQTKLYSEIMDDGSTRLLW
jgi:hypothetical protein